MCDDQCWMLDVSVVFLSSPKSERERENRDDHHIITSHLALHPPHRIQISSMCESVCVCVCSIRWRWWCRWWWDDGYLCVWESVLFYACLCVWNRALNALSSARVCVCLFVWVSVCERGACEDVARERGGQKRERERRKNKAKKNYRSKKKKMKHGNNTIDDDDDDDDDDDAMTNHRFSISILLFV